MFEAANAETPEGMGRRGSVGEEGVSWGRGGRLGMWEGGGGGVREREHLTLTSQRSCRLASSLVSIPLKTPDAFLSS